MKQNNFYKNLLIFLLGFLSLGAFYGGLVLIISPDGAILGMPLDLLKYSPFKNFLVPGIILLAIFGIFPFYTIYGLLQKPDNKFFNSLNLLSDYHFAWTFSIYTGIALIIWINIQTLMLNSVGIIHTFYAGLGILIVCIALLPQTRIHYKV